MQKNDIDLVATSDASGLTHYLKEAGNGSMKRGVLELINNAEKNELLNKELEESIRSGNIKNVIILGLSVGTIALIAKVIKNKNKQNNIDYKANELKDIKESIENMSEEEVEKIINDSLEAENNEEEKEQNA